MDDPTRSFIDEIESVIMTKYPGLDAEEVVAALEVVKMRLIVGEANPDE